jgi:hypothetical protein
MVGSIAIEGVGEPAHRAVQTETGNTLDWMTAATGCIGGPLWKGRQHNATSPDRAERMVFAGDIYMLVYHSNVRHLRCDVYKVVVIAIVHLFHQTSQ